MTTVHFAHEYDVSADRLWALVTDFDVLAKVMRPFVRFRGLPEGHVRPDQKIELRLSMFGVLPYARYVIRMIEVDENARRFHSYEQGLGVRRWEHRLHVQAVSPLRARLEESIEIEAGVLTPLVVPFTKIMYARRHKVRVRLLQKGTL